MSKRIQEVVPFGNGWAVKQEGSNRIFMITSTQRDAITVARERAKSKRTELIIYGRNGQVRIQGSYAKN